MWKPLDRDALRLKKIFMTTDLTDCYGAVPRARKRCKMDSQTRKLMFSSGSSEYETPEWLFDRLDSIFSFDLDPCASDLSHMVKHYFTKEQDGLNRDWGKSSVFINPPYSDCSAWVKAAHDHHLETRSDAAVLIPARTDTRYWHNYIWKGANFVLFIKGRLKFVNRMALSYACMRELLKKKKSGHFKNHYDRMLHTYESVREKKWKNPPSISDAFSGYRAVINGSDIDCVIEELLPPSSAPFPSAIVFYTIKDLYLQRHHSVLESIGKLIGIE